MPFKTATIKSKGEGFYYKGAEFVHYTNLNVNESAIYRVLTGQKLILLSLVLLIAAGFLINWHFTVSFLIATITLIYFCDLLFNLFLIYRSFSREPEIEISYKEIASIEDSNWPSFTIFCPLYKEWEVLPQFINAIHSLDYPQNKLQVLLLLEEDDTKTIERVRLSNLPNYFQSLIIPQSMPKTKPKALNFGLKHATGDYAVIYDAEDVPEPKQLKKAVLAFQKVGENVVCIQAKLNFYNTYQNILTRLFTAEYSLWFDIILTGLQSIHAPIPLGGTSNIFRTNDLKKLSGWDPFNVTEDADLGMRIVRRGYRTAIINSTTREEANSNLGNWFRQRIRWIKGYIQTYLVHTRKPLQFASGGNVFHILSFHFIIGSRVLTMLVNPFMWLMTISYFVFHGSIAKLIESFYLPPIYYLGVFTLFIGNFLATYYFMIGAAKRKQWQLMIYVFLTPLYWLLISAAAIGAIWQLLKRPYHWNKTTHGFHLKKPSSKILPVINLNKVFKWNFILNVPKD